MRDLMGMMKKAQEMQARMSGIQDELQALEVTGSSGGGMVSVVLNGKGDMRGVSIDPSLLAEGEGGILEDLIIAAHADAKKKSEEIAAGKMAEVTAGMPLPPGMKLPF